MITVSPASTMPGPHNAAYQGHMLPVGQPTHPAEPTGIGL
jgi:hypothetical protein